MAVPRSLKYCLLKKVKPSPDAQTLSEFCAPYSDGESILSRKSQRKACPKKILSSGEDIQTYGQPTGQVKAEEAHSKREDCLTISLKVVVESFL